MMVMEMANLKAPYLSTVLWLSLFTPEPIPLGVRVLTAIHVAHKRCLAVLEAVLRVLRITFLNGHHIFTGFAIFALGAGDLTSEGELLAKGLTTVAKAASCGAHNVVSIFVSVTDIIRLRADIIAVPLFPSVANFLSIDFRTVFATFVTDLRAFDLGEWAFLATEAIFIADLKAEDGLTVLAFIVALVVAEFGLGWAVLPAISSTITLRLTVHIMALPRVIIVALRVAVLRLH